MDSMDGIIIDNDDDEMLDLFSFGAETETPFEASDQPLKTDKSSTELQSAVGFSANNHSNDDDNNSYASNDSFICMLEDTDAIAISIKESNAKGYGERYTEQSRNDSDMQEILDWLDADDQKGNRLLQQQEQELCIVRPPQPKSAQGLIPKPDVIDPSLQCEKFESLEDVVTSQKSSISDIRTLLEKENFDVNPDIRPALWSKIICEKTLEQTMQSSLADSFQQWQEQRMQNSNGRKSSFTDDKSQQGKQEKDDASCEEDRKDGEKSLERDSEKHDQVQSQISAPIREEKQEILLEDQYDFFVQRILSVVEDGDSQFYRKALRDILRNYFDTGGEALARNAKEDCIFRKDSLIPPVVCIILASRSPPPVASVMLSKIIPLFMPILALSITERHETGLILHHQFYLLVCYHLPLLVLHLDKFMPDWYKCYPDGKIPQSWLISHFAGETNGNFMNAEGLLHLWDLILTTENHSLRFFLIIALLENHAERLLLLTDVDLKEEFDHVLNFSWSSKVRNTDKTIECNPVEDASDFKETEQVKDWYHKATLLWKETPLAVCQKLKVLEDEAVKNTLVARREAKEEKLRLQQEEKDKALQAAKEAEKERKADEARIRLTRARLIAFYRQHNPGKENNVDKIMISYEGRYEILDAKLKLKYGVGFNPALKPKPITINKNNSKLFSTMNSGFGQLKSINKKQQNSSLRTEKRENIVVQVPASEALRTVFWRKDASRMKLNERSKMMNSENGRIPLKFHIVDCRLDAVAKEQGRLPASVTFCPESVANSKDIEEEKFESLRGSVHLCVMSEGYAALPQLYGHKMTSELAELIREEEERKDVCARFFLSKGFPFVSVMEGGYASAHAYICREGPKIHLNANDLLTDYDPEVSLFGRFEKLHSMSGRDKAQRSLQNLFDSSMTALTKHSKRLESINDMQRQHQQRRLPTLGSHLKKSHGVPASPTKESAARRPFSRFGSLGIGQNNKRHEINTSPGKSNNFAGSFKKFQMNTMARIRTSEGVSSDNEDANVTSTESNMPDSSKKFPKKEEVSANGLKSPVISKV